MLRPLPLSTNVLSRPSDQAVLVSFWPLGISSIILLRCWICNVVLIPCILVVSPAPNQSVLCHASRTPAAFDHRPTWPRYNPPLPLLRSQKSATETRTRSNLLTSTTKLCLPQTGNCRSWICSFSLFILWYGFSLFHLILDLRLVSLLYISLLDTGIDVFGSPPIAGRQHIPRLANSRNT